MHKNLEVIEQNSIYLFEFSYLFFLEILIK